jgi:hypothetical protein
MTTAFPLAWPSGWPRTPWDKRQPSRFSPGGLSKEAQETIWELGRLGARNAVISTNIELRRDGLPYSGRRAPDDPGVAVYFTYEGRQQCIPCDRWATVEENLRAIWKSIEALRSLERWGAKSFVDAAFTGFTAIAGPASAKPWWEVLGVSQWASREQINAAWRGKAQAAHPDAGGSDGDMSELNVARDQGLKARAEAA